MDTKKLRFYFITDENAGSFTPFEQVKTAILGGATIIQYRNKSFSSDHIEEVILIREFCKNKEIPFLINDNIDLAAKVMADGVHLGQDDASPELARKILGKDAIIGATVSGLEELASTDLSHCDYMGTGPVFPTSTKANAKPVKGLSGFKAVADKAPVPVVAIGGITAKTAPLCFDHGASGIAVISFISRSKKPAENARRLGLACENSTCLREKTRKK